MKQLLVVSISIYKGWGHTVKSSSKGRHEHKDRATERKRGRGR